MSNLSTSNEAPNPISLPSTWRTVSLKQVALATALVVLTLMAVGILIALRYVLLLLFLGIVVSTALAPAVERLRRFGLPRMVAVWSVFALLIIVVSAILAVLVPFFISQIERVIVELPQRYEGLRNAIATSPSGLVKGIAAQMPSDPFAGLAGDQGVALGVAIASALPSLARGLALSILVLLLSYYWLYYRALAVQSIALLVPIDYRAEAVDLWNQIEAKIGAFVRGLALLGTVIAILSALGYSLIGLPYALTIAIIAGILEAIPYIGPTVTMVLAAIVGLSVSPLLGLEAIGIAAIVQLLENIIVVPRVMDRAVGVRPVVTLLALAIFGELFGILGALLAVPLAAASQVLLDRFVLQTPAPGQLEIGGRDQLALLRYRTQDLAGDLRQQFRSKETELSHDVDATEEELESLLVDLDTLLAEAQGQR